jgi:hypothetical protein
MCFPHAAPLSGRSQRSAGIVELETGHRDIRPYMISNASEPFDKDFQSELRGSSDRAPFMFVQLGGAGVGLKNNRVTAVNQSVR